MKQSDHNGFESHETGRVPIEEIHQLQKIGPGEPPVTCQVCEKHLRDGARATAYAVRDPEQGWQVIQTRCVDHPPCLRPLATLGVDEYILTGRLARVVDTAFQQSYPILLDLELAARAPPTGATA
jgi:hypothetical protein